MHIPFRALSLPLLLALPATVRAVFQDEVGHIDYHHKLLGVPQRETTFFHRPRRDERASLLYTLTDLGVLGAVNPSNGDVVWRQQLLDINGSDSSTSTHLRAGEDEPWLASASGGSVQSWEAISGRNVWSLDFRGRIKDLEVMELTGNDHKDVLTLHAEEGPGASVARRIHGTEGRVLWEYREINGDVPLQVSTNVEKVFVVTLHGSLLSYGLKVIVLDTLTGRKLDEIPIGTRGGEVQSERDVMFVGANSAAPIVAWTDNALTTLKVNVLGTKAIKTFPLVGGATSVEVHSPHLVQSVPHFLVHTRTKTGHKGDVFHIDLKSNAIEKAYELPLLEGGGAFSTSSINANVFFTRVTSDEVIITSSQSHGILSRWPLQQQNGREGVADKLQALHGVSEVLKKAEDVYAVRSAVVNDADDWVLIRNGEVEWTRPEGLSGAVAATWAEIPESESEELAKTLQAEAHSNPLQAYVHRVNRHIDDLQYLPDWLQSIPGRLLSSVLGSDSSAKTSGDATTPSRDSFGFNKLAVLATRRGKLYGLDVGNHGRIVWSKKASETPAPAGSIPWDVRAIYADDVKGLVTVRGASGEFIIVKADTGSTVESIPAGLFPPIEGAAVVDSDAAGPWLLPIGVGGRVSEVPAAWAPNSKQTVVTRTPEGGVQGLVFVSPSGSEHAIATPVWTFLPPQGQRIATIASRAGHDPIASIGRVLGDRSVRYKYLNPNTIIVATIDENVAGTGTGASLAVHLLDTVSGQVLHSAVHEGVDAARDISCTIAENWFVCSFYGEYTLREPSSSSSTSQQQQQQKPQSVKGHQLLVSDLYESELSNDRGPLGDTASNYSSFAPLDNPTAADGVALPAVITKAFVLPGGPLTALTSSQTRQGISSRLLLAYSPALRAIVGIPRAAIDPRRPAGRDPTPQELEEGLARYSPALEVDGRWVVSHEWEVLLSSGESEGGKGGKARIITSPALLESTSLVLAFGGIDVFGTRVAPSMAFDVLGNGFNKLALVATVGALGVGVLGLGPLVRKKQINMRWGGTT